MVAARVHKTPAYSRIILLLVYKGGCYDIVTSRKVPFVLDLPACHHVVQLNVFLNKS